MRNAEFQGKVVCGAKLTVKFRIPHSHFALKVGGTGLEPVTSGM